jgi:DNA-binding GntR family transcriptional regulator
MARPVGAEQVGADGIFSVLRDEILSGQYPPGTPFREVALSERFGLSRTPVREALQMLVHERLLERIGRRLQVPSVDPSEIIQIYDLRILLEGEAAEQAAKNRNVADLLRLEALLDRDRSLVDPSDAEKISTNLEFHSAIWSAAHNQVLQDLLERLSTHLVHSPRSTLSTPQRWEESLGEHAELVAAISTQDSESAALKAKAHMETARAIRLQLLRESAV